MRTARFVVPTLVAALLSSTLAPAPVAHAQEVAAPAGVDVLELADGTKLEGQVVGENDEFVSFRAGGVTRAYPRMRVQKLTRGAAPAPTARTESGAGPSRDGADPAMGDGTTPPAPDPKTARKEARKEARKAAKGASDGAASDAAVADDTPPLSEAARSWLDELIRRADSDDATVRRSVAGAMMQLGPAALPEVRRAEQASEGPLKNLLGSVVRNLEGQQKRLGEQRKSREKDAAKRRQETGRRAAEARFQALVKDLELTADQVPKMRTLLQSTMETRTALLKKAREADLDAYALDQEFEKARKTVAEQAAGFLDEGQLVLFEEHAVRLLRAPVKGSAKKGDGKDKPKPKNVD